MSLRDEVYKRLAQLALTKFSDIVHGTTEVEGKLRILMVEGSFVDIWLSEKKKGVYAYHWERRAVDGTIYRHNNLPDKDARRLETFPKHFHFRSEKNIKESNMSDLPEEALESFLLFARKILRKTSGKKR